MKSLAEQMSVYAAYHRTAGNKACHFVGVPAIVWSLMVLLALPGGVVLAGLEVTPAHVVVLALLAYYLNLDFALGVASVVVFTVLLVAALEVVATGAATAWTAFGVAFAGGWIIQFVGHGVWEKRRPALVDNLFQVFVAPIFLVAEFAFALGMKRGLRDDVEARVAARAGA